VWGSSTGDVYAVGEAGTILHLTNGSWTTMPGGKASVLLAGIWGD